MSKKLKDRRLFLVIQRLREWILDSELDIGVIIYDHKFRKQLLIDGFFEDEITYAIRYLVGKNYLESYSLGLLEVKITVLGYDEWLFPNGPENPRSVFISYATEDKILAGKIKAGLESIGINAFLAHEDVEPTALWRDKIISDLKSAHVFIALRTKNYIKKQYTEQECGFALALNKRILTICVNIKSSQMGFCSEYQGVNFKILDEDGIVEFCKKQLISI